MSEVTLSVTSRVKGYGSYRCGKDLKAGDTVHSFRWDGELIAHHEDCCSPYCPDSPTSHSPGHTAILGSDAVNPTPVVPGAVS